MAGTFQLRKVFKVKRENWRRAGGILGIACSYANSTGSWSRNRIESHYRLMSLWW